MHKNIRIFIIGAILITTSLFVAYWTQQYMQRSRADASAPITSFYITGSKVNPGEAFDLILRINPNLHPLDSFDISFTYDPAKVTLRDTAPATILSNITTLSSRGDGVVDVQLLSGPASTSINTITHKVRIYAISSRRLNGETVPFSGSSNISMVKVSFKLNAGQAAPLNFKWVDSNTFTKDDEIHMEIPGQVDAISTPTPTPKLCGVQVCTVSAACYQPPNPSCPAGNNGCAPVVPPMICVTINPSLRPTLPAPTPIGGAGGADGITTLITERKDLLYINSIGTYQSPFRYEQPIKLEKGTYTVAVGAKVWEKRGRGLTVGLTCNEDKCGTRTRNQTIFSTPSFPQKATFSELKQSVTISDEISGKGLVLRIFCEDGTECELDYISIEDAWGNERVVNSQFENSMQINDTRHQPNEWTMDATGNMYGTVDSGSGVNGALMINNSAK